MFRNNQEKIDAFDTSQILSQKAKFMQTKFVLAIYRFEISN